MIDPVTKTLKTKARDNHGHEYPVHLTLSQGPVGTFGPGLEHLAEQYKNRWVLCVKNTPGSWYMSTLLERGVQAQIALDFGAGWMVTNFSDVMREAIDNL